MSDPKASPEPARKTAKEEPGMLGINHEKKYYSIDNSEGGVFIKRSIVRDEWMINIRGDTVVPCMPLERLKNEAAAIEYVRTHTDIPVPTVRCAFQDRGCYYVVTDMVPGICMADLPEENKATVTAELERHIAVLHGITSTAMGGFLGAACLPMRVARAVPLAELEKMRFLDALPHELVLCHGDLSQHNVIVDEKTLKINAIIDWEYAGFYPKEFDAAFYKRVGPSAAIDGEENDVPRLLEILEECARK
ncbi:kinase-like protein [Artomyces pyxidatus]|uniref:Kinase-like protein n=1 Tax=Artomyces pyxidatus TaxID=48021 RepID=A0ACB8SKZ2_9AGAM|nr:kinase-like protein [Artomyces pyxidatus]